jgi:uncharacterized protein (TIGR02391 family)
MVSFKEEIWRVIHPELKEAVKPIVFVEKYDDAIFSAFKIIEASIQDQVGSKKIGRELLNYAFDEEDPKIKIYDRAGDNSSIKKLFEGSIVFRNERGHRKAPVHPCESFEECIRYLSFASLLLDLLTKCKNTLPKIESVRIFGTSDQPRAELKGLNFSAKTAVKTKDSTLQVVRSDTGSIEVILPPKFSGYIQVYATTIGSNQIYCDCSLVGSNADNMYELISTEIVLFRDPSCQNTYEGIVGGLIRATESGHTSLRIIPVLPNSYSAGVYISHGPYENRSISKAWYKDPDTNDIKSAWDSSLIASPEILGSVKGWQLSGIELLPSRVMCEVGEHRTLTVIGWEINGPVRRKVDYTKDAEWTSKNADVAFVKNGKLFSKKLGKTSIDCTVGNFHSTINVDVAYFSKGEKIKYFEGLPRLQKIRFDRDDNLYICNQSDSVFRLDKSGVIGKVVTIQNFNDYPFGIDCIAVGNNRELYVNNSGKEGILKFEWDGKKYGPPTEMGTSVSGPKKGIIVSNDGALYVAVMGSHGKGKILCILPDGTESSFDTLDMAIHLALDQDGNICIPSNKDKAIHVYKTSGEYIKKIPYDSSDSVSDILIDSKGRIYLTMFSSGTLISVSNIRGEGGFWTETIADGFNTPCGVAMDSAGKVYVSNFSGDSNSIDKIYL